MLPPILPWKSLSEGQSCGLAFRQAEHFNRLPALPASLPQQVEDQIDPEDQTKSAHCNQGTEANQTEDITVSRQREPLSDQVRVHCLAPSSAGGGFLRLPLDGIGTVRSYNN